MLRSGLILMIKQKALAGQSPYSIGKELGISKNTAKKYATGDTGQHRLKGRTRPSKLDPFKPTIDKMVQSGIFNCVVIYERLQELGYTGGITIIKDYVKDMRPARSSPAVRRYETPPGKQVQMDWGITHYIDEHGIVHKTPGRRQGDVPHMATFSGDRGTFPIWQLFLQEHANSGLPTSRLPSRRPSSLAELREENPAVFGGSLI